MEKEKRPEKFATSFLGKGWSFPPGFSPGTGLVEMSKEEQDIQESLTILLGTRPGERIMQPNFGCDLTDLFFEPISTRLITYIKDRIKTAILYFEPRITVFDIQISADDTLEGKVNILVEYTIRTTNTRSNFVYPFYTTEATGKMA